MTKESGTKEYQCFVHKVDFKKDQETVFSWSKEIQQVLSDQNGSLKILKTIDSGDDLVDWLENGKLTAVARVCCPDEKSETACRKVEREEVLEFNFDTR